MWPDRLPLWQRRSYFSISGDKLSNPGMRVLTGFLLFIYVWGCIAYETARPGAVPFVFSASPTLTLCRPVLKPPKNPQISEGPRENLSANGFSPLVLSSLSQDKPAKRLRREEEEQNTLPVFYHRTNQRSVCPVKRRSSGMSALCRQAAKQAI